MGIQKDGLLGFVYGKVGPSIGRRYRGINMLTGPYEYNGRPFTNKQMIQQYKLGLLNGFLSYFSTETKRGFRTSSKSKTSANVAFSYNHPNAFIVNFDEDGTTITDFATQIDLNYPKLVLSRGDIFEANCPAITLVKDVTYKCSWLPSPQSDFNRATDMATLLVWDDNEGKSIHFKSQATRGSLGFNFTLPDETKNHELHFYLLFSNESGKLVGDTTYLSIY